MVIKMKKISSLVLVLSIICITRASHAEQYWAKTYSYGIESRANYITQTLDGGYIVRGFYRDTHGHDLSPGLAAVWHLAR